MEKSSLVLLPSGADSEVEREGDPDNNDDENEDSETDPTLAACGTGVLDGDFGLLITRSVGSGYIRICDVSEMAYPAAVSCTTLPATVLIWSTASSC